MAPPKRKRGDRTFSYDNNDSGRPSPHRPQNLGLGQVNQQNNARGGRRSSRGGARGGTNAPQSPSIPSNSPAAMSPPATIPPSKPTPTPPSPAVISPTGERPPAPASSLQFVKANEYITSDRLTTWRSTGRKAIVDAGVEARVEGDDLTLSMVFEELVRACLEGVLDPQDVGSLVQEVLAVSNVSGASDPTSLFLDVVSTLTESGPSHSSLKPMLESTGIDPTRMRAELETNLLTTVSLVRPTFAKMAIRKATHALYRQANYNLLREETEGYSKLITEYFTTVNSERPSNTVATDTFERVKALIGAFDLDVGRVLDVTLDVFANLLVKHCKFFIKFLRVSSWWPKQKIPDGVEWEDQGFSSLPGWALPESFDHFYTDEEKDKQALAQEARDRAFWERVNEVGLKAYFELGSRRITRGAPSLKPSVGGSKTEEKPAGKKMEELPDTAKISQWTQEWMAETNTLPPPGNRIAAQLLGFKLRFYASDARDAHDTLPDNLIYLAALLIKIGFISLLDLYPHLYPPDEEMAERGRKLQQEKRERERYAEGNSNNALAMAGALADDTVPGPVARLRETENKTSSKSESEKGTPGKVEEEPKEKLPEPVDQKTQLLRSLLCIGAIPEAFYIIGRFPWLLDVHDDLHAYIHRLLNHSLTKVYEQSRPYSQEDTILSSKKGTYENGIAQSSQPALEFPPRKTLRWAKLEQNDSGDGIDYKFYWDDWADNVPICQNVDDVFKLCDTLFNLIGPEFGKNAALVTKMARIGKKSLEEDRSEENQRRWINLSASLLAPALTFTEKNPGVVNEMFELFKHFDIATRYSIYASWYKGASSRKPAIRSKFESIAKATRRVLSRISRDNTKPMARDLAKITYACPGIVFETALRHVQSYPNMVDALVECSRYFTYLAYDVLTWSLITTLDTEGKKQKQADGMLISPWLQSAALFVGRVYKRYSLMNPTPMLQYVTEQLYKGNSDILAVLEQMIASMAGIMADITLTDTQIFGISAGPLLRTFTLEHYLGDQRHVSKTSARRLMKCLVENGLAPQIMVSLAQELGLYLYRPDNEHAPTKVLGVNLDNLHAIFAQYLELLRSNLQVRDFDTIIPNVVALISDFGITPSIAFAIARESLTLTINETRAKKAESTKTAVVQNSDDQTNDDVEMGEAVATPIKEDSEEVSKMQNGATDIEMKESADAEESTQLEPTASTPPISKVGTPNQHIQLLADQLKAACPSTFGNHMNPVFYVTFWQLSLRDFHASMDEYQRARSYFLDKTKSFDTRRDVSMAAAKKRDADRQAMLDESNKYLEEAKERADILGSIRANLKHESACWFDDIPMVGDDMEAAHEAILQDCFMPRILLSPQDALYSSAMLKFMHSSGVPGFRTMKFLDMLFRQRLMTQMIFMCSPRESQNLGRFLNEVLKELRSWHTNQSEYMKKAYGVTKKKDPKKKDDDNSSNLPGFGRTFKLDRTPATMVDYEDFRRVLYKWHSQLYKALETCLRSGDFGHIRNAINVLKAVSQNFPTIDFMGKGLNAIVQNLAQTEPREDLKLSAQSLLGDFRKKEKTWVSPNLFSIIRNAPQAQTPVTRTGSEQPTVPQPSEADPKPLNAAAPSFEPKSTTNGASTAPATAYGEHEDGEVEDENKTAPTTSAAIEPQLNEKDALKPDVTPAPLSRSGTPSQSREPASTPQEAVKPTISSSNSIPIPPRPESRQPSGPPTSRPSHILPNRPDAHGPSRGRAPERMSDRPHDYHGHNRHDPRGPNADYGRLDRPNEVPRDSFGERREASPGRRPRGRTPERGPNSMERRDPAWGGREPREYADERQLRLPPRDRGPPLPPGRNQAWGESPRDSRDLRDPRDRVDLRGPLPPHSDTRGRMHNSGPVQPADSNPYRRDAPPDRPSAPHSRSHMDRQPSSAVSAYDRNAPIDERPLMNPERAALLDGERGRPERRERGSRPQSPRRHDDRLGPPPYQGRNDPPRDHREDRNVPPERAQHERMAPPNIPPSRDRQEDATRNAPTGPRGGRGDHGDASISGRNSRDFFQSSHPPRGPVDMNHGRLNQDYPPRNQAQDPNYGRLNAPSDNIPSGPRGRGGGSRGGRNFTAPVSHGHSSIPSSPAMERPLPGPMADRRDHSRRESYEPPHAPPPQEPAASDTTGIHPSRLTIIQTDVTPSSGPRVSARGPGSVVSPSTRGPPVGPAASDRGGRRDDKNQLRAINNVLNQNLPSDRGASDRGTSIRGRATRASGPMEPSNAPSPASHSYPGTPNTSRPESFLKSDNRQPHMSTRVEGPQDEGREGRSHRESRRGERSSRHRSRSPEHGDRRNEERVPRNEDGDRERGSGRERRGGTERDSSRRERSDREREGRERRDRGPREEGGRSSTREELGLRRGGPPMVEESANWGSDPRGEARNGESRGRVGERRDDRERRSARDDGRDGRKRGRGADEAPPHENKRPRRSGN